jgi:hypothetical protein
VDEEMRTLLANLKELVAAEAAAKAGKKAKKKKGGKKGGGKKGAGGKKAKGGKGKKKKDPTVRRSGGAVVPVKHSWLLSYCSAAGVARQRAVSGVKPCLLQGCCWSQAVAQCSRMH